jgi:putative peptidoglycan lipid II flippase
MGIVVLAKPLGLIVQMLMARYFGAGEQYDAYALALFLVSYVGSVAGLVFTSVVLPFTIQLRKKHSDVQIHAFQNATVLLFIVPAIMYMLVLVFQGDFVVSVIGHELPATTREFAERMIRFMAPPGLLLLVVAMFKSILNLNHCYRLPTASPAINAVVMLVFIVALHGKYGIWSVPIGFAVSGLIQSIMLGRLAWVRGDVTWTRPVLPQGALGKLWQLSWMMLVTQAIVTLYYFIDKIFAASLPVGSISSIAYSYTLVNFGSQVFSFSLIVVMFTKMSELISEWKIDDLNRYIRENLERVVRLVVPASIALSCAAPQVVRVLFQRGEFTEEDSIRTASVLAIYMVGLPAIVSNLIVGRIFFSLQRMGMKIVLALQYLGTNVIGNLLLIERYGVVGLAISTAITINLHYYLSAWALQNYNIGIQGWRFAWILLRHYIIGFIVFGVYVLASVNEVLSFWLDPSDLWGAIGIGGLKTAFILTLYLVVFIAPRGLRVMGLRRS